MVAPRHEPAKPVLYRGSSDPATAGVLGRSILALRRTRNGVARGARHPTWLLETIRSRIRRARTARRRLALAAHADLFVGEAQALAAVTDFPVEQCEKALVEVSSPERRGSAEERPLYGARPELVRIAAALVRLLRPDLVVETGVAQGITTAALLEEFDRNAQGELHSIDLPVLSADPGEFVGRAVPAARRDRWTLHPGPSRRLLKPLLETLGTIDMFLHDADHSYAAQLEEYRTAWPWLRSGGVLLSDDVGNRAFLEFADDVGARPILVGDSGARDAVGLLRR